MSSKTAIRDYRRLHLPYGRWICADGREVLFNRRYRPLWQRLPDGTVTQANPDERVPFIREEWFYRDSTPEPAKAHAGKAALADWGLANAA